MAVTPALVTRDVPGPALAERTPPVPAVHGGRRDRKKQATRRALRNAALQLVAERGFAHVTVEDIAEAADVATRTFFNYFPSKESAVIGADPERIEEMRASLLRGLTGRPSKRCARCSSSTRPRIDEELDDLGEGKEAWFRRFCMVREDPELLGGVRRAHRPKSSGASPRRSRSGSARTPITIPTRARRRRPCWLRRESPAMYWSANGGVDSLARLTGAAIDSLARGLSRTRDVRGLGQPRRTT